MSTQSKVVIGIIALGVAFSLFVWKCTQKKNITPILVTHDTFWKPRYVHDTIKGATVLVPYQVIHYMDTTDRDTSTHVLQRVRDSVIYLYRHDTIVTAIRSTFLKQFPNSPKLIEAQFKENSINLNLLGIDGQIVTKNYIPDYTKYNYEFSGSELKMYPVSKPIGAIAGFFKTFKSESFMTTTYNPFTNGAMLRVDYSLMYKRLGLTTFAQFSTDQTPKANVGIGLRVQIK